MTVDATVVTSAVVAAVAPSRRAFLVPAVIVWPTPGGTHWPCAREPFAVRFVPVCPVVCRCPRRARAGSPRLFARFSSPSVAAATCHTPPQEASATPPLPSPSLPPPPSPGRRRRAKSRPAVVTPARDVGPVAPSTCRPRRRRSRCRRRRRRGRCTGHSLAHPTRPVVMIHFVDRSVPPPHYSAAAAKLHHLQNQNHRSAGLPASFGLYGMCDRTVSRPVRSSIVYDRPGPASLLYLDHIKKRLSLFIRFRVLRATYSYITYS